MQSPEGEDVDGSLVSEAASMDSALPIKKELEDLNTSTASIKKDVSSPSSTANKLKIKLSPKKKNKVCISVGF